MHSILAKNTLISVSRFIFHTSLPAIGIGILTMGIVKLLSVDQA